MFKRRRLFEPAGFGPTRSDKKIMLRDENASTGFHEPGFSLKFDTAERDFYTAIPQTRHGQVAQLVERGPEKAGVGGSIPSLATISFKRLATIRICEKSTWREQYANIGYFRFHVWRRSFEQPRNY